MCTRRQCSWLWLPCPAGSGPLTPTGDSDQLHWAERHNPWKRSPDKQQSSWELLLKPKIYLGKGKEGRLFFQTPNAEGGTALTGSG